MHLVLTRSLPAAPAAVWPFITDPALMNRWSTARIDLVAAGDDDGVGMTRRVTIDRLARFEEVVERADFPHRFVYRVVRGAPLRRHRGEITLADAPSGCALRWEVDAELTIPGSGPVVQSLLRREIGRSLERLAAMVRDAEPAEVPEPRAIDDRDAIPTLRAEAESILRAQNALADRLESTMDPKRWFARVYAFVTESQLALCAREGVPHPAWVLRLVPRFHHYGGSQATQ